MGDSEERLGAQTRRGRVSKPPRNAHRTRRFAHALIQLVIKTHADLGHPTTVAPEVGLARAQWSRADPVPGGGDPGYSVAVYSTAARERSAIVGQAPREPRYRERGGYRLRPAIRGSAAGATSRSCGASTRACAQRGDVPGQPHDRPRCERVAVCAG